GEECGLASSVPIPKFATTLRHAPRRTSESKDTSKSMILVPLLNPKFATDLAATPGELRVRGTRPSLAICRPYVGTRRQNWTAMRPTPTPTGSNAMDAKTDEKPRQAANPLASHHIIPEDMEWDTARFPGCATKTLFFDKETGVLTALFRMEPGAVLPDHEHVLIEQTYVLEGSLVDKEGPDAGLEIGPGEFVGRPARRRHSARAPDR